MADQSNVYEPQVKIHADSYNIQTGHRLTTFEISNFPKNLLAELNTHRVFSRNAASSRAIPVKKVIERIRNEPYLPAFTKNQPGMVGQPLGDQEADLKAQARELYLQAMQFSIDTALKLAELGIHKEPINRLLEPWMTVPVLISGTEWDNFFKLRCSPDASPHFNAVACEMRRLMLQSTPTFVAPYSLHSLFDRDLYDTEAAALSLYDRILIMAARCARISYITHGSTSIDLAKDLKLGQQLLRDQHLSPFEHIAVAVPPGQLDTKNYRGFCSFRAYLETNNPLPQITML